MSTPHYPYTIPALKEWEAGNTAYSAESGQRIVIRNPELHEVGTVFAEDLYALTGRNIAVTEAELEQSGDIILILDVSETVLNPQGYVLEIDEQIRIRSMTEEGVFYGTRTLLQLFAQGSTIAGGTVRDWPDYAQRSLMVDVGRQYFSLAWLEKHIRELAYFKYNFLHLHLSDNFGFRLESERYPEIVSTQFYTRAEITRLHEIARKYRITLVPEIDVPGHLDAALTSHPELLLTNTEGIRQSGDLDLAKEAAYTFVENLLEEFIPLFPGPYWHLGADEYLLHGGSYTDFPQLEQAARERYGATANSKDIYLGFVNWAHEIVQKHGKITRIWSDGQYGGAAVKPPTHNIIYEHWVSWGPSPVEIVEHGIPIVNANLHYLYYVPGSESMTANPAALYEEFEPHMFCWNFERLNNVEGITVPEGSPVSPDELDLLRHHPLHLGAKLHVWCDDPTIETEDQIAEAIEHALRSLAQKNWGSSRLVPTYEEFKYIIETIGHAPLWA